MKVEILTLFPEMFAPMRQSMMKRAADKAIAEIAVTDIRPYADDPHQADDLVYGGGAGMVMKVEPVMAALRDRGYRPGDAVIITSPAGRPFRQQDAQRLAARERLFIVAGHYEGIDQRVTELTNGLEYSVGDFVLTGGELPAMMMADSVIRLLDGVLGDDSSLDEESFNEGLLEYPQYTRPPEFEGLAVPAVLLGGDHRKIAVWRRREAIKRTWQNRPDLLRKLPLSDEEKALTCDLGEAQRGQFAVALVHYPVLDPKGHVIATSVTNLDIHDIARLSATFGATRYYIVQPGEEQKALTERVIAYWTEGHGSHVNPDRCRALSLVRVVDSLEDARADFAAHTAKPVRTVATTAKIRPQIVSYTELRERIEREDDAFLLCFGTGYGLTEETLAEADHVLKPIEGRGDYNHLAVRSAVAIILDRLFSLC